MLQDRFNIIGPRMFNITNSFQMRNVSTLHKLKRLKIISSGVPEPITVPENLSPFLQEVMTKKIEEERKQETIDCANVASELVEFIEDKEASINEKIDDLKIQIKALKSQLKYFKEAKEYGKATSNYLPLAALVVSELELRQAGVTMEEQQVPKAPKIKKS